VHPDLPERCAELFSPLLSELGYSVESSRAMRMQRGVHDALQRLDPRARDAAGA
jgi:hypothetical protein